MNTRHYKLEGRELVVVDMTNGMGSLLEWARALERTGPIACDYVGQVRVISIFLGLDFRILGNGPPLVFETMTFDHEGICNILDNCQWRWSTLDDVERGHERIVKQIELKTEVGRDREKAHRYEG